MHARFQQFLMIFFMCHQRPERSFFYKGKQFPLCARCTGLAIGYVLSLFVLILFGLIPIIFVLLLIVPTAIDGTGQLFNYWQSTNSRRLVTGVLAGIGLLMVLFHIAHAGMSFGQTVGTKWLQ